MVQELKMRVNKSKSGINEAAVGEGERRRFDSFASTKKGWGVPSHFNNGTKKERRLSNKQRMKSR